MLLQIFALNAVTNFCTECCYKFLHCCYRFLYSCLGLTALKLTNHSRETFSCILSHGKYNILVQLPESGNFCLYVLKLYGGLFIYSVDLVKIFKLLTYSNKLLAKLRNIRHQSTILDTLQLNKATSFINKHHTDSSTRDFSCW